MSEVEQAIAQIADIRAQLAASTRFRGYAPEAVGVVGLLSLMITVMQVVWPDRYAANDQQYVLIWGLLMAAGCLLIAGEAILRTYRTSDRMAHPMLISAMRTVIPATVMAAVIPAAVLVYAPQAAWIVPGFWQMQISLVAFASYSMMPRKIIWPGAWFLFSGGAGLFLAGAHGGLTPLVAGAPFVIGHFAIAWALRERKERGHG
ncbi:hypothetical protein [Novosphingobium album (ex Hu et al. 2023)]|uniref:DUF1109 domain-containing protein n=1 Tax=Novosphingobium album (ex Hu et al. 2023) TaxID=2930093 RepID=A0ABT0AWC4_9SPHN|nr:hypothetical protein [Novosphingobium album (ex Hu et al. 2023)]MCJ2176955.1 hypothetical protein [Novosphingobium album (ex Hu et al. 2023)]